MSRMREPARRLADGDRDAELFRLCRLWETAVADVAILKGSPDRMRAEEAGERMVSLSGKIGRIPCRTAHGAQLKRRVALHDAMVEAERLGREGTLAASYQTVQEALATLEAGDVARAIELLAAAHAQAEEEAWRDALDTAWGLVDDARIALENLQAGGLDPAEQQASEIYAEFCADPIGFVYRFMLAQDTGFQTGSRTAANRLWGKRRLLNGRGVSKRELMELADAARGGKTGAHRPSGVPRKRREA